MSIGAVAVPAYTTLTQSDYEFLIQHSETRCIFTSSGKLAETLRLAAGKVGNVEAIIYFDEIPKLKKLIKYRNLCFLMCQLFKI